MNRRTCYAACLSLAFAVFGLSPASAAPTTVVAQHSGKCLDVIGGNAGTGNGVLLEQWTCVDGAQNQVFALRDKGGSQYEIVASHSNKCVGVVDGATANGAQIEQLDCAGLPKQLWTVTSLGAGTYRIVSVPSGRCLDVTGGVGATGDGVLVELWDCVPGATNQIWALTVPDPTPQTTLVAKHSGKCLDVIGGHTGTGNGVKLEQWSCVAGADNQAFTLKYVGHEQYQLIAKHSGKCVQVIGGSTDNGAQIDQWDCNDSPQQRWTLSSNTEGYHRLISVVSGKCLDVTGGPTATADGALMEQWDCVAGAGNQLWTFSRESGTPPTGPVVTAASCSASAVQTAVDAATTGTTVQIPAGNCNWGRAQVTVPGGIHLRGAGKDVTLIRRGGAVPESAYLVRFDCSNGQRATLSDMTLAGYNNSGVYDKGLGLMNGCVDFRVFNAKFTGFVFSAIEVRGAIKQRGVIYENDFINNYNGTVRNLGYGVVVYGDGTWPALELGTQNAVFVEDNTMSGNRHHIASNNSSRYVFRHNTVIATDLTKDYAMTDAHGKSSSPAGSRSYEIYNNTYKANLTSGRVFAAIGIRGGDGVIFNNTIAPSNVIAYPIVLSLEGYSCGTYPAPYQVRQAWIWNNNAGAITNRCTASIQPGRDYFTSAKPGYVPYAYPHPLRAQ